MSKTIEKHDLEGVMVYIANALKSIGKTDFEGERVATCAHQWNTANICKNDRECWTTTLPREFCGRNTSKNKLVGSKP